MKHEAGDLPGREPLDAEDAVRAMLDGEVLHDDGGWEHSWDKKHKRFVYKSKDAVIIHDHFTCLHRHPVKRLRYMTRWEVLAWANSEASRGWAVLYVYDNGNRSKWSPPQFFDYAAGIEQYRRARLLPDLSGVDESTIQGFEVEE
jgi:hypothetical protein